MSTNPFADAIKPKDRESETRHVEPSQPFFHAAIEADRLKQEARNMTRQQLFDNGFLTVHDMDDEELRCGRMRDPNGRIPRVTKTMDNVPRDLYDAMVLEHQQRTQEKYRQSMDAALGTIMEIMLDDTCEPRDRLEAAKHVKEQVMGKTPDRVQVQVAKAPWEEMFVDFATTSRERHARLEQGVIDAEVVDEQAMSSDQPGNGQAVSAEGQAQDTHDYADQELGDVRRYVPGYDPTVGDPRIHRPTPAPSHDQPATNRPIPMPSNSDVLRWERCDQLWLAERRKAAKKRIADAKSRRIAKRLSGVGPKGHIKIQSHEVMDEDGDTGKLRHTIE